MGRVWETAEIRVWETAETRPCHLASAARRAAARADPHAGKALAAEGLSLIHISEPTRRTPISYAVFCLKKKVYS